MFGGPALRPGVYRGRGLQCTAARHLLPVQDVGKQHQLLFVSVLGHEESPVYVAKRPIWPTHTCGLSGRRSRWTTCIRVRNATALLPYAAEAPVTSPDSPRVLISYYFYSFHIFTNCILSFYFTINLRFIIILFSIVIAVLFQFL